MNKLIGLVLAVVCTGCAVRIDTSDVVERGGATFDGTVNLHYVAVSSFGANVAYQTGSNLSAALQPARLEGPSTVAIAHSPAASISVRAPRPLARQTAEAASQALQAARTWYPTDFSDQIDITIDLIEDGPEQFGDAFILARAPWPMAFRQRYDQVHTRDKRIEFASTLAHEGYHLANAIQGTGLYLLEYSNRRDAGLIYEETAAHLIGACVSVSLGNTVDLRGNPTVTIRQVNADTSEQQEVSAPFGPSFVEAITRTLNQPHGRNTFPTGPLYIGFYRTLFHHYAEGADIIEPGTPAAARLLDACDRLGPDVTQVPMELRRVAAEMAAAQAKALPPQTPQSVQSIAPHRP